MSRSFALPVIAVGFSALLVAGCSGGKSEGGFSQRQNKNLGGVFRYPIVTNPTTLDPAKVEDGDTIDLLQQTYEGLVAWSPDNRPEPRLAESIEISDDGTVYTFKLRPNVKFHNGATLTSADVKWSIERVCTPKLASPTAKAYLGDIVGVVEMADGKATSISGITTPDDLTVQIKIDKPRPYWLGKFTYLNSAIMPIDSVKVDEEIKSPEQMIGTGPFKVSEYVSEQVIKLEAFADYHGGAPKLQRIERRVVKDAVTRLNMYKSGEIDLVMLERQDVPALKQDAALKDHLVLFDRPAIWYVGLNQKKYPAFKDKKLRQAIAMAIDKETIVNELLGGVNRLANTIMPPSVPGFREEAPALKYNVDEAKRLLAEAGYGPGGKALPPLELMFREGRPDVKIVAEAVTSQLQKNLGIEAKLVTKEWRAFLEIRNQEELPFFHMRWAADYLDPENFISFMTASYGPENKIGYKNEELDALCRKADVMDEGQERLTLYQQAEDIVLSDAVIIPIYFQRDAELINPRIKGLRESVFGHLPHTTVTAD